MAREEAVAGGQAAEIEQTAWWLVAMMETTRGEKRRLMEGFSGLLLRAPRSLTE